MKISQLAIPAAALFLALAGSSAQASIMTFNIGLSGSQAVLPNSSTASGTATVVVDDVLDTVSVTLAFTGLTGGNASAAHIHCCVATTANGPVVIPFTGFPSATSGTYSKLFSGVSTANIAGIEAGQAYINIHNSSFSGGEIRGDIVTPEPATYGMITLALGGVMALRRRLRKY